MTDNLYSQFLESEKDEITNATSQMDVWTIYEVPSFDKFVRWVERWYLVVDHIQSGYLLEENSFHNDMDLRPLLLEQLMNLVSDTTTAKIQVALQEADDIYFEATVPLEKPETDWWHYNLYPKRWWRKPKVLIGSLKQYYEERGIK